MGRLGRYKYNIPRYILASFAILFSRADLPWILKSELAAPVGIGAALMNKFNSNTL